MSAVLCIDSVLGVLYYVTMKTVTLDTHKFTSVLQERGFSREQAEGLLEAFQEIDTSELTTKQDLSASTNELKIWTLKLLLGQTALFTALVALLLQLFVG